MKTNVWILCEYFWLSFFHFLFLCSERQNNFKTDYSRRFIISARNGDFFLWFVWLHFYQLIPSSYSAQVLYFPWWHLYSRPYRAQPPFCSSISIDRLTNTGNRKLSSLRSVLVWLFHLSYQCKFILSRTWLLKIRDTASVDLEIRHCNTGAGVLYYIRKWHDDLKLLQRFCRTSSSVYVLTPHRQ